MIKIWKLYSRLIKENSFINCVIFVLFLLESIINVNSSNFRIPVNLRTWPFLRVFVWGRFISILIMRLIEVSKTWWFVIILLIFFKIINFFNGAHLAWFFNLYLDLIINPKHFKYLLYFWIKKKKKIKKKLKVILKKVMAWISFKEIIRNKISIFSLLIWKITFNLPPFLFMI